MHLKRVAPEAVVVTTKQDLAILYSYGVPVVISSGACSVRVDGYISRTTERHISQFLHGRPAARLPEREIRKMVEEA